jgi:fructokinase
VTKTVLAYGETLWDLLPSGPVLGGAPFNFVYRVNSLGERGVIVTRLGRDELGRKALAQIEALGMATDFVQWDEEAPTGTVEVDLSDPDRPDFTIVPGVAYDRIEPTDALMAAAAGADCVCFGTLIQRDPQSRATLGQVLGAAPQKAVKLLDINLRRDCYSRETVKQSLREADVLKLNDDEARELGRMFDVPGGDVPAFAERAMREWGLSHCVVTLGGRGAYAASAGGERVHVPGYRVEVADACGAGDAFTAGFIRLLLRGRPLEECCELGCALGAMVAAQVGATVPIAPEEVEEFMACDHERTPDGEDA